MADKKSKKITVAEEKQSTLSTTISTKKLIVGGLILIVVVLAISVAIPSLFLSKNKGKGAQATKVISQVDKILLVPKGSDPTVIEVSDVARLKKNNPDFYKDVEAGDYLLMYSEKAVIYRQSKNQIINVAPIVSKENKK